MVVATIDASIESYQENTSPQKRINKNNPNADFDSKTENPKRFNSLLLFLSPLSAQPFHDFLGEFSSYSFLLLLAQAQQKSVTFRPPDLPALIAALLR
jgi:hypothetical protein